MLIWRARPSDLACASRSEASTFDCSSEMSLNCLVAAAISAFAGGLIATHRLVGGRRVDVWNPEHRAAAEALALGWKTDRPDLRLIADHDDEHVPARLELDGDFDVDPVDLEARYPLDVDAEDVG